MLATKKIPIKKWLLLSISFLLVVGAIWARENNLGADTAKKSSSQKSASVVKIPIRLTSANTPNQNIEEIPELGITINVPDSIKDLSYAISNVQLKNGQNATLAMFSTTSLAQLDPRCSVSSGPLGSLEKVSGQYPTSDPYAELNYGRLIKQFSTYYISAGFPQSACSGAPAVQNSQSTDENNFTSSISNSLATVN